MIKDGRNLQDERERLDMRSWILIVVSRRSVLDIFGHVMAVKLVEFQWRSYELYSVFLQTFVTLTILLSALVDLQVLTKNHDHSAINHDEKQHEKFAEDNRVWYKNAIFRTVVESI